MNFVFLGHEVNFRKNKLEKRQSVLEQKCFTEIQCGFDVCNRTSLRRNLFKFSEHESSFTSTELVYSSAKLLSFIGTICKGSLHFNYFFKPSSLSDYNLLEKRISMKALKALLNILRKYYLKFSKNLLKIGLNISVFLKPEKLCNVLNFIHFARKNLNLKKDEISSYVIFWKIIY